MIGSVSQSENAPKITLSEFTDPEELMDKELDTRVMGEAQPLAWACFMLWVRMFVSEVLGEAVTVTIGTGRYWDRGKVSLQQNNREFYLWFSSLYPNAVWPG